MPYLFISNSSRRPQFVKEDVVEENWKNGFGSVSPVLEKIEKREEDERKARIMKCNYCGHEVEYQRGMVAFCRECKVGLLGFIQ